ncbi:solute carrier organic anion transporter family member 4A1 isoform X1 [Phacochoerus africanus]|uniref:solute carrier organic anion transporter family member 4A1 isoform X1 n=1 Tax=Phacochoerus africanus TaxID=41426 RepID=UPI001FDA8D7B|nr:solute carrier organic anion transporter family member 4A1 isoform X1 [Phacochoerus africanus]XP_047626647.1 solute carrier organic anion transporter family member 4A1 isoform X1 [Phacochoerus africanus]
MPQHSAGDKPFVSMPQPVFPRPPLAANGGCDHTPPVRRASLGSPLSPGALRAAAHGPLDSSSQPLCQPEKHGPQAAAREVRYVAAAGPGEACGWRAFAPACLQVFNTPCGFLLFLCAASFLQGMTVNGFINSVITSIERRFDLHSYQSGLTASSYDVAACLCLTFVSYFGGHGHKPRWLGWGVLVMGAGSLVFALPHFTTGPYEVQGDEVVGTCRANQSTPCGGRASSLSGYRLVFMLGQFLHGVGATPLYTLGVTYLDENVKSSSSPVYLATFYTAAILGPAAGYLVGGALLNIYTEIGTRTELTTESPHWVGAWWVGFLGAGAAAFLIAVPILGYPRQLPGSQRYVVMRASETHQLKDSSHKAASNPDFGKTIRDLPLSIWLLLKNPTFILLCLAGATEATLIAGMSTFGPKFLESQFSLSASEAATLFGYLVVPAGGGGTFLGGFFVNKLKLRGSGTIKFCLLCTLASGLTTLAFLTHCPNVPMAGVTVSYNGSLLPEGHLELTAACNAHCGCWAGHYTPVCGSDGLMYHSPCHAGCSEAAPPRPGGQKVSLATAHVSRTGPWEAPPLPPVISAVVVCSQVYRDCSCVPQNLSSGFGHATAGKCTSTCQRKPLLLVFIFVVIIFTFLSSIPALTATLRCVCDRQRSFALGIQWIVVRTLGGIPGPIAFGWVIDKSCLLWQDQCGQQGSCFVYQNSAMSQYMLIMGLLYKTSSDRATREKAVCVALNKSDRSWASSSSPLPASSTSPCRRLRTAWKPLCPASPRPPTIPQTFREPPRPSSSRAMSDRSPARQGQGPPGSAAPELCLISRRKG